MSMTASLRASRRAPLLQVAKSAVATGAAWLVCSYLFPATPPVFAAIAALLVVQPSLNQSLTRAIERSVGVIAGVLIASALSLLLGNATWVILVTTAVSLLLAWALRMTPGTANQVAISAILVLALGTASPSYAFDRVLETLIGAIIGIVVNLAIVPPVAIAPAHRAVDELGDALADALDRLADALATPKTPSELAQLLDDARAVRPTLEAAEAAIAAGADSLTLNPRGRRHRDELDAVGALLDRFRPIVTQMIGMTRACSERYDASLESEPAVPAIAEQLRRAAHDVRLQVARAEPAPAEASVPDDTAALTSQLTILRPSPAHWVLIGSLLEDLRRIHATLTEPTESR
ncbi:aromatic acid exporter family protein [Microbacterium sp. B2969]|uniref:Aromatic acid exporter family protein n=1 Tax=Microbacterium alkaliflavum TaxID=3248839 RepID=A0ABW7QD77_9MICO